MNSKLKNKKKERNPHTSCPKTPALVLLADETGNIHTSHLRMAVIKHTHTRTQTIIAIASGDKGVSDPETQEGKNKCLGPIIKNKRKSLKRDLCLFLYIYDEET